MHKLILFTGIVLVLAGCRVINVYAFEYTMVLTPQESTYTYIQQKDSTLNGQCRFLFLMRGRYNNTLNSMTLSFAGKPMDVMQKTIYAALYSGYDTILPPRNYEIMVQDLMVHTPLQIQGFKAEPNTMYTFTTNMGSQNGPVSIHSRRPLSKTELEQLNDQLGNHKPVPLEKDGTIYVMLAI